MDLILFLAAFFFASFMLGMLLEKVRIPWIFSSLLIGFILSAYNPFSAITSSPSFSFLAELGMLFLLFIIGFELDVHKLFSNRSFVILGAVVVILSETIVGTLLMHYVFGLSWIISIVLASSFSTVGEAVLLPILDEFRLTKTRLGQTILGIGVIDDILELLTIGAAIFLISHTMGHAHTNILLTLISLVACFGMVFVLVRFHKNIHFFKFKNIPSFFLFILFFIFLFVGVGRFVEAGAFGAILAGIALRNIVHKKNRDFVASQIRILSYGFLAPIFFLSVGVNVDFRYLWVSVPLVLLIFFCTGFAKVFSAYVAGRKRLGAKKAIIVGVGVTVKLSTSIVVLELLYNSKVITSELYTILIASSALFTVLVPVVLPLLIKWFKISSA